MFIMLLLSCSDKPERAMVDEVNFSVNDNLQTIGIYSSEYRGMTHYRLKVEKDGDLIARSDYLPLSVAYKLQNIEEGEYSVVAEGFCEENGEYKLIAEEIQSLSFDDSHDVFDIELDSLASVPSGTICVDIVNAMSGMLSWEIREGIGLDGKLVNFGEETVDSNNLQLKLYTQSESTLDSGAYTFIAYVENDGKLVSKNADVLTLLPGLDTSGTLSLENGKTMLLVEGSSSDSYQVEAGFEESNELLFPDAAISISLPSSAGETIWYVNGKKESITHEGESFEYKAPTGSDFLLEVISLDSDVDYFGGIMHLEVLDVSGTPELSFERLEQPSSYNVGDLVYIDGIRSYIAYIPSEQAAWGDYMLTQEYDLQFYMPEMLGENTLEDFKGVPWEDGVKYENPHDTAIKDEAIGDGKKNTDALIKLIPDENSLWHYVDIFRKAAGDGWFVPSKLELREIYNNRDKIGNLSTELNELYIYWASSESRPYSSYAISFYTGSTLAQTKAWNEGVRLCRYATEEELKRQNVEVTITSSDPEAEIRYTIDGSNPTSASLLYKGPFAVEEGSNIKVREFSENKIGGDTITGNAVLSADNSQ